MFQLADADRCRATFVRLGQKVECIASCQLLSVLISALLKIKKKKKNSHLSEERSGERPPEPDVGITQR